MVKSILKKSWFKFTEVDNWISWYNFYLIIFFWYIFGKKKKERKKKVIGELN